MKKEINGLVILDIVSSIIVFLICLFIVSYKVAILYLSGVLIGLLNYIITYICIIRLLDKKFKLFAITFFKIVVVALIIIPFAKEKELVLAYVLGLLTHYLNMIINATNKKGSA